MQPTVVEERKIRWHGQITSLSAFAQKLLDVHHPAQGALYFTYNGIVLARLHKKQIKILATRLFVKPNGRLSFF
jgi:hypothetical protein